MILALYNFYCENCKKEYEQLVKMSQEYTKCCVCGKIMKRTHCDLPSPPKLIAGCGGYFKPSYSDRTRE